MMGSYFVTWPRLDQLPLLLAGKTSDLFLGFLRGLCFLLLNIKSCCFYQVDIELSGCSPGLALSGPEAGTGTGADLRDPGAGVDLDPLHVRVSQCSSLLWRDVPPGHTGRGRQRRFVQELDI